MADDALIPFPLSSAPGESAGEGAGRIINGYAEPLGPTAPNEASWKGAPGLTEVANAAGAGSRGFLEVDGTVFAVIGTQLVRFTVAGGAATVVGAVAGTAKVIMARNNKKPTPDKVLVTENGAFTFTDVAIAAYPDPDLPQPNSVSFQDGYFFFTTGDGRCFASALNDTAINALTVITAESKPDGLLRAIPFNNELLLFGQNSFEVWTDTANTPPGFPYLRSTAKSRGLVAATAIAGHENGFGAAALMWVADHNRVVRLRPGYETDDVSPPDLDRLIEAVADKTTLEACVYVAGGVPRFVLSCPLWTWECNLNTMRWNERESFGRTRWIASQSVYAFGKWLVGDAFSGTVFAVDRLARKEGANPLRFRLESGEVQSFPNRIRIPRVDFDLATGVGHAGAAAANEQAPVAEISYSDDGGSTWSLPQQVPLGRQGEFFTRITLTNQGQSGPRGRRWRIDMSDPNYACLLKGVQMRTMRRK